MPHSEIIPQNTENISPEQKTHSMKKLMAQLFISSIITARPRFSPKYNSTASGSRSPYFQKEFIKPPFSNSMIPGHFHSSNNSPVSSTKSILFSFHRSSYRISVGKINYLQHQEINAFPRKKSPHFLGKSQYPITPADTVQTAAPYLRRHHKTSSIKSASQETTSACLGTVSTNSSTLLLILLTKP